MLIKICRPAIWILLFSFLVMAQSPKPQKSATAETLDALIKEEVKTFKGKVSLFAKNLDTGATYGLNADDKIRTASTIKLAIMVEAFAQVAEGKIKWTDELLLTDKKKVSGSGVLTEFSDGVRLPLRDCLNLMMVVSDNTATNLILDLVTADAVNARMEALGLKNIRLMRKVGGGGDSQAGKDTANKKYGLGAATPREMALLMEKLERSEVINAQASKEMLAIMKREQFHDGMGRTLNGVQIASKVGALDALRSNVGIIYSKRGRIAMAITCDDMPQIDWTDDNPGYLMLSRLSLLLTDGLGK